MTQTLTSNRYQMDHRRGRRPRVIDTARGVEVCICLDEAYAYRLIASLNLADIIPDPIPKVAVVFPYYRTFEGPCAVACFALGIRSAYQVGMLPIQASSCYIERNRNGAVKFAKQTGIPFDYMFWIDSDMIMPEDALICLLQHDKDIVGANYRIRVAPFKHAGAYLDGTDSSILKPGLHQMAHVPTGLLLTRMSVFDRIPYPWFKAPTDDDEPRDDVYFCNLARECGIEVWTDHDLTFRTYHRTVQDLGWFDESQVVEEGMGLKPGDEERLGEERAKNLAANYHRDTAERRDQARSDGMTGPGAEEIKHERKIA